ISTLFCRKCRRVVRKDSPGQAWEEANAKWPGAEVLIAFRLPLSARLSLEDSLALLAQQGYQRILVGDGTSRSVVRVEDAPERLRTSPPESLVVVQDRVRLENSQRARFVEAAEQAYHFGKGKLCLFA